MKPVGPSEHVTLPFDGVLGMTANIEGAVAADVGTDVPDITQFSLQHFSIRGADDRSASADVVRLAERLVDILEWIRVTEQRS